MPLIDIQVIEGVFSDEEKADMISKVTAAFGEAAGGDMAANVISALQRGNRSVKFRAICSVAR